MSKKIQGLTFDGINLTFSLESEVSPKGFDLVLLPTNIYGTPGTLNQYGFSELGSKFPKLLALEKTVRRHIICLRFRPGLRDTLLTSLVDIKRRLCGIASVDVR